MTFHRRIGLAWFALCLVAAGPARAADFTIPRPETRAAEAGQTLTLPPDIAGTEGRDIGPDIDAAFALADQFPAERYELAPLAQTFGQDARAAFTWVRDTIRFDPYAGHLRDGEGVLAASGGNAYDRALLLKALLEAMGVKVRLAHATLDETAQAKLKAAIFAPRAGTPVPAAQTAFKTDFTGRLRARAGRDFALLTAALGPDALAAMEAADAAPELPLSDHLWVQAEIDGAWVDLDTSLADASPGTTLAPADTTPDTADPAANQTVTLSVSATLSNGEQALLSATLPAADAANSQILLYFEPKKDGIGGAIAGGGGYLPVLVVNGAETKGEPIAATDDGGAVGGAIDALGGDSGETMLQALTLKIVTQAPGEPPIETTRILAAAPPGGTMETDDHGIVAMRWVHHVMVSNGGQSPRAFAILKAASMDYAVRALAGEAQLGELTLTELLWPTTSANLALPTASERLFVEGLNAPGTRAFVGRPRVFIASTGARTGGDGTLQGFDLDLAIDGVDIVTETGAGAAASRFWYGMLEAALETEYGLLRLAAMASDSRDVLGASLALGTAPLTVIGSGVEIAGAPQAMKDTLGTGARVIVAGDPAAAKVWWTVQADGTARAVLDPSLGGLTGGGGYYGGGPYVNSSAGGPRYIVDPNTGNTVGEVRNGRDMMYRGGARAGGRCGGGQEYITLLGCVSIPVAVGIGILAGAVIVVTYGSIAVTIIRAL